MTDFNSTLGFAIGEDPATVLLQTRPEHEVAPGVIHFAVLTTLAEVAAARAVGAPVVPASLSVHFLSPARAGKLVARGRLLKGGRRLAVAEGEVLQQQECVAKATVTFSIRSGAWASETGEQG